MLAFGPHCSSFFLGGGGEENIPASYHGVAVCRGRVSDCAACFFIIAVLSFIVGLLKKMAEGARRRSPQPPPHTSFCHASISSATAFTK